MFLFFCASKSVVRFLSELDERAYKNILLLSYYFSVAIDFLCCLWYNLYGKECKYLFLPEKQVGILVFWAISIVCKILRFLRIKYTIPSRGGK